MGGSRPNSDLSFFLSKFCVFSWVFLLLYMFPKKKLIEWWEVGVWLIRVFLGFLDFF